MDSDSITHSDDNEDLDPRIQLELDTLNRASVDINVLERSLEEEKQNYEKLFAGVTQNLNILQAKLKSSIEKARSYYDVKEKLKQARSDAQAAAKRFDRAISTHQAAQEMVSVAENAFQNSTKVFKEHASEVQHPKDDASSHSSDMTESFEDSSQATNVPDSVNRVTSIDLAWQEMLNVAVTRVYEAERELTLSEIEHQVKMNVCVAVDAELKTIEKDKKSAIKKSKPYYEAKSITDFQLQEQLRRIKHLESKVAESKQKYTQALRNLEMISEEIHFRRESKLGPRGQGVGAERNEDDSVEQLKPVSTESAEPIEKKTPEACKNVRTYAEPFSSTKAVRGRLIGADADETQQADTYVTPDKIKDALSSQDVNESTSGRGKFSSLTPEDAKRLISGESSATDFLRNEDADLFSLKIESDLKKLSSNELFSSYPNLSSVGDEVASSIHSCLSSPIKSQEGDDTKNTVGRSFFEFPSLSHVKDSNRMRVRSKSAENLYHN